MELWNAAWLMILENVDDDGVFFGDDPDGRPHESSLPHKAHGAILIMSRNKIAATNLVGPNGHNVEVEPMGEENALALLRTKVPFDETNRPDATTLVHALDRLPLSITHAAGYIKTRADTTTISTYIALFQ